MSQPATAREEIRTLLSAYPFALDSGRRDDLIALFADNGTLQTPFGQGTGPNGIREHLDSLRALTPAGRRPGFLRHNVTSQTVVLVDEQQATATSYFLVLSDVGVDHWGRYEDVIALGVEGWRIAHRHASVEGSVPGSWYSGLPQP